MDYRDLEIEIKTGITELAIINLVTSYQHLHLNLRICHTALQYIQNICFKFGPAKQLNLTRILKVKKL